MTQPKFKPRKGQVDYTDIRYCPVINCIVQRDDEILLERRADNMHFYPGCYNGVSGFLDTDGSIEDKVREELFEEVGIGPEAILSIKRGSVFVEEAPEYGKTWIIFPILVAVNSKATRLNWEVASVDWYRPTAAKQLKLVPGFEKVINAFSDIL